MTKEDNQAFGLTSIGIKHLYHVKQGCTTKEEEKKIDNKEREAGGIPKTLLSLCGRSSFYYNIIDLLQVQVYPSH
jgi:hypothetical protein